MISDEWLLGFIEGEGCFSITLSKRKDTYQPVPVFAIKLSSREEDTLKKIKKKLNLGKIYFQNEKKYKQNKKTVNQAYLYRTTGLDEAIKIAEYLKKMKFCSKNKETEFKNWCKCINLINKKKHLTKKGLLEIVALRELGNRRSQWNKKSYCTIKSEIEPCEIYKKNKKIPENCRVCFQ